MNNAEKIQSRLRAANPFRESLRIRLCINQPRVNYDWAHETSVANESSLNKYLLKIFNDNPNASYELDAWDVRSNQWVSSGMHVRRNGFILATNRIFNIARTYNLLGEQS